MTIASPLQCSKGDKEPPVQEEAITDGDSPGQDRRRRNSRASLEKGDCRRAPPRAPLGLVLEPRVRLEPSA